MLTFSLEFSRQCLPPKLEDSHIAHTTTHTLHCHPTHTLHTHMHAHARILHAFFARIPHTLAMTPAHGTTRTRTRLAATCRQRSPLYYTFSVTANLYKRLPVLTCRYYIVHSAARPHARSSRMLRGSGCRRNACLPHCTRQRVLPRPTTTATVPALLLPPPTGPIPRRTAARHTYLPAYPISSPDPPACPYPTATPPPRLPTPADITHHLP